MGGLFSIKTAVWTFWFFLCSVKTVFSSDFLQELALDSALDVTKVNVSQDEYTRMMSVYLDALQETQEPDAIPILLTYNSERKSWWRRSDNFSRIRFPVKSFSDDLEVQNAEVRLLIPAATKQDSIRIKVFQVLSPRRRHFLDERVVHLSREGPKWCELDVTSAAQRWLVGERNLGIVLECIDCTEPLRPLEAAMSALVLPEATKRRKRFTREEDQVPFTDCTFNNNGKRNNSRPKCCRHPMRITFKTLNLNFFIQPKYFDGGYCQGSCPQTYKIGSNHSHFQTLIHRLDKKAAPRVCCAASEMAPVTILRIDPEDTTKLKTEKWTNMKVLKCACS